jgi:hypothetical protein
MFVSVRFSSLNLVHLHKEEIGAYHGYPVLVMETFIWIEDDSFWSEICAYAEKCRVPDGEERRM